MYWSDQVEDAFRLWIARKLSVEKIAIRCDCTPKTIWNWRQDPEWKRREAEHLEMVREETRRIGLATREGRIRALQERYDRLARVVRERGKAADQKDVPGGKTGYLCKGPMGDLKFDAALAREMRAIAREIAIELGQFNEKQESSAVDVESAVKKTQDAAAAYRDPDDESEAAG